MIKLDKIVLCLKGYYLHLEGVKRSNSYWIVGESIGISFYVCVSVYKVKMVITFLSSVD